MEKGRSVLGIFSRLWWSDIFLFSGTIVDSVIIGACRDPIRTFQELKRKYSKAKEAMTIVFKNHETTVPENPFAVDTSWSYDGRWQGGNLGGWAGGAEDPWVMDSGASHWIH